MDRGNCNILASVKPKYKYKVSNLLCNIGGENMATRKCNCTTRKANSASRKTSSSRNAEASTDNAKTSSRTTSKKTSRTKNCN